MTSLEETKKQLFEQLDKRVGDGVLEQTNADLLKKHIGSAESSSEAEAVFALGAMYKKTGLHYDVKLEKAMTNKIHYFKKNNELSFVCDPHKPTHKLIIGDNYVGLQNLLISYKGAIDVIYIDPPYGKDSMGQFADTNYDNSLSRDNLLSMLKFRLDIAKQLLSEDGVVFCSIDDRNQAYVKCLFDDVFSERNFIGMLMWKKTDTPPSLSNKLRKKFEYVLCYTKTYSPKRVFAQGVVDGDDAPLLNAGNPEGILEFPIGTVHFNIPDGVYKDTASYSIKLLEDITVKDGCNATPLKAKAHFKWQQSNVDKEISEGTYFLIKSDKFSIRYQKSEKSLKKPSNVIDGEVNVGTNETANSELESLGFAGEFDYAKPVSLIQYLVKMGFWNEDDITVLDFFAGSGTTAHAVLELNRKDGGTRTCILCQLNEKTDTTPNGIAYDVTSKRLKRIMTGECYDGFKNFQWINSNTPYGENLDVFELASSKNDDVSVIDSIDESLYGKQFDSLEKKIDWICSNFQNTQNILKESSDA